MSHEFSTPAVTASPKIPKHKIWLFRPIKQIVLDVGKAFEHSGDVLEVTGLPMRVFAVRHPDHVGQVLKHPEVGNRKYVRILPRVKWVMGRGGYILEGGSQWREQRKLVQSAFRGPCLRGAVAPLHGLVTELLEQWDGPVARGERFDVCPGLQRLVTRLNFQMFFSHRLEEPELTQIVEDTHFVQLNFVRVSPLAVPLPANLRFRRCIARLRNKMAALVAERRRNPGDQQDLLSVLLAAEREQGWTESDVIGEIFSVYFGAAVVATTLAWTLYLMGSHREAQRQVIAEVTRELQGRPPSVQDLARLPITRAAILETTRLFPPSWGYPRHCQHGMTLGDFELPPDCMVIPMVYFTHRHPQFWDAPEVFRLERFLGETEQRIHPHAHLPFGAGARICLGAQLAPMVLTLTLAGIFQKLMMEFQPRFETDPVADFGFEIHPRDQIQMSARRIAAGVDQPL